MIPLELIEQFARGNGSVFVGAGLSIGARLPSWAQLVQPLSRKLSDELKDKMDGQSPEFVQWQCPLPDLAQYYENIVGRPALVDYLLNTLSKQGTSPTSIHKKLVNLPVQRLFTTNFDRLLEAAFDAEHLDCRRIVTDQHLALIDNAQKVIVKLHGDLESPETLVLTSADYESYFSKNPGIANLLGMDLHSRTVLFLGYSFSDSDLRMILSNVSRTAGELKPRLFAVQLNPTLLEEKELERRGIRVIRLDVKPDEATEALDRWLEELARRVRESPVRQPALQFFTTSISFIDGNLKSRPSDSEIFLGREAELSRVLKGLRSRYPLIAIKGFAGVGKTSLAIKVGQACSLSRGEVTTGAVVFEYVVWISAEDKADQKPWLEEVLNTIAITTNIPAIAQEQDKQEKAKQVNKLLQCYKILIIIDNFEAVEEDFELIEWLEGIPYPSKVLITTRDSRLKPEPIAAWVVSLSGLELIDAVELLRRQLPQQNLPDQNLYELARVTDGNPQAMKLAIGLAQDQKEIADLGELIKQLDDTDIKPHKIFQGLLSGSWGRLLEPARQILLVTPLFAGVSSILRGALEATTGLSSANFDQGLEQCLRFGLLERESDRYVIHPLTRAFARLQLNEHPDWKREARRRCTDYFLQFVRKKVVRLQPDVQYWNALVSPGMAELAPEWSSIQQVMSWADEDGQDEVLVEFIMLLVHYMDSQFLNVERLEYVEKAVAALQRLGRPEEEALLRIDALGWTYVEVLDIKRAHAEIFRGLEIARSEDLRALGLAWRARVRVEEKEKDFARADELIKEAQTIDCSPWISFRVYMAAGDIELKRSTESAQKALDLYQLAAEKAESYGGEGYGYQIGPRVGLALLGLGQIEEAECKFKNLSALEQIPIGKLYAEYGLALVTSMQRSPEEALVMLNDVKAKLSRRTRSNLLLRLIEEQEARMAASQEARSAAELSLLTEGLYRGR